jgi:predicted nucleotidyltransferase
MRYRGNPLLSEAIEITSDLGGDVAFLGAFGVFLYTNEIRESQDLDCASLLTNDDLFQKGYIKYEDTKNGWSTPRLSCRVDIFNGHGVNGIPIKTLIDTANTLIIDRKKPIKIKAVNLETQIVMKHRTNRDQDRNDLGLIARKCFNKINQDLLHSITDGEFEYQQIKDELEFYKKQIYR